MELQESGIRLSAATWLRLQSALTFARNRLRKNYDTDNLCENIENLTQKIKKGSKNLDPFSTTRAGWMQILQTLELYVTTFSNLINAPIPSTAALKKCLGLWNSVWLHNDMRNFLYLLRTNGLLLNNRLNTIDPTVSPHWTVCRIVDRQTAPRDSFLHFFYDCAITNRLLQRWCGLFEPPLQLNDFSFRNFYWYCTVYNG